MALPFLHHSLGGEVGLRSNPGEGALVPDFSAGKD
jgi:hypothetical protein